MAEYDRRTGRTSARQRAMATLARRHRALFERLYAQARRDERATDDKARRRAYQAARRALARELPAEFHELFTTELANGREGQ